MGFTIVETMIFLAVSGAMLIIGFAFFSGVSNRNQFALSMRDIESYFQDVANDVSAGFYPTGDVKCTPNPATDSTASSPPTFSPKLPGGEQGTNTGCVTLGKVAVLNPALGSAASEDPNKILLATVAGNQKKNKSTEAETYAEAKATTVYIETAAGPLVDVSQVYSIRYGAKVRFAYLLNPKDNTRAMKTNVDNPPLPALCPTPSEYEACAAKIYAVGFYGSLSSSSASSTKAAGQHVLMQAHNPLAIKNQSNIKSCIEDSASPSGCFKHWPEGAPWVICFNSADGQQAAQLTIDGSGATLKTKLEFKNDPTCSS